MAEFDYRAVTSLEKALELKRRYGPDAHFLAGGTNLIMGLRAGAVRPRMLIDLNRIKGLDYLLVEDGRVRIGPLARVESLLSLPNSGPLRLFSDVARVFGNPLIRNRATVAGNLADASPAADLAVPLLALDARLTLRSDSGQREIPLAAFFLGPNKTALQEDELITEISFPSGNGELRPFYWKLGLRNADAVSIVSIALLLEDRDALCQKITVALGAVAPVPFRAEKAEAFLGGQKLTREVITDFARLVGAQASPIDDIRASAGYRRRMVEVLAWRGLSYLADLTDEASSR